MKNIILSVAVSLLIMNTGYAITTSDLSKQESLHNAGFSPELGRMAEQHVQHATWEEPKTQAKKTFLPVRFVKVIFGYFDPSADYKPFGAQKINHPKAESL